MSLLELIVVILVLLSLITILLLGTRAWKSGSDRTVCIINMQNVQKGLRSYANLYGLSEGSSEPDLKNKIIGTGCFVEITPSCPAGGNYSYGGISGPETIPPIGELYMHCDQEVPLGHLPPDYSSW